MSYWNSPAYQEIVLIVISALSVLGFIFFFLRKKNLYLAAGWASVKSWLFTAPFVFVVLAMPSPWPLVGWTLLVLLGAKVFFQIAGIYHRSNFIWLTYLAIITQGFCIYYDWHTLYNTMPMIFLGAICLIPVLRNSYKRMLQYMALSLIAFSFFGWALMHVGWIWQLPQGTFLVIYLAILTEVYENLFLSASRWFGRIRLTDKIDRRRSLYGFVIAFSVTVFVAFGLRHLLPDPSEPFWIVTGVVACLAGSLGDLTLTVIRKDLGIKDVGTFIIGRGDLTNRLDRLIFVAPIYFYLIRVMTEMSL